MRTDHVNNIRPNLPPGMNISGGPRGPRPNIPPGGQRPNMSPAGQRPNMPRPNIPQRDAQPNMSPKGNQPNISPRPPPPTMQVTNGRLQHPVPSPGDPPGTVSGGNSPKENGLVNSSQEEALQVRQKRQTKRTSRSMISQCSGGEFIDRSDLALSIVPAF